VATRITRRRFFRSAGSVAVAAAAGSTVLEACQTQPQPAPAGYVGAPSPVPAAQPPGVLRYLTGLEASTLGPLFDQVIPGAPGVPSASEAGVVEFVDRRLALDQGVPTYTDPPYAQGYHGSRPPGPDTADVIWVPQDQLYRYGIQEVDVDSRTIYRRGLQRVDEICRAQHGTGYAGLSPKDQAAVYTAMTKGTLKDFGGKPSWKLFSEVVQSDAAQGWLADPAYGGNRDLSVWKAIGYPGAQRAYTPEEMRSGNAHRPTQGMRQMSPSVPGQPEPGVLLPQAGAGASAIQGPSGEEVAFECRTSQP
jgi:gluconate 2-dehydrogenase gamma chain